LYAGGELLGGCDIILELAEAGELAGELATAVGGSSRGGAGLSKDAALRQRLEGLVNQQPVMLFMKVGVVGGMGCCCCVQACHWDRWACCPFGTRLTSRDLRTLAMSFQLHHP
jgi:hypothetical protein